MARVVWTEPALQDLDAIAEYIALENHDAAARLVQRVFDRVERLKAHPQSGRKVPELPDMPYREIIVPPCRLFYRIERKTVYLLYVMRSEQELRRYLLERRGADA